jgi:hypothetical protein
MKALKYSLLSALLISSASFATEVPTKAPTEQVVLPSIIEVVSFCSGDKSCNSITPVIRNNDLNYSVQYKKITAPTSYGTDPTNGKED